MTSNPFPELCRDLLASGVPVRFRARGWSMHPAIRDGEILTVVPAGEDTFSKGDVLLFEWADRLVAHRLKRDPENSNYLICKGDSWSCKPEIVQRGAVLGTVAVVAFPGDTRRSKGRLARWKSAAKRRLGSILTVVYRSMYGLVSGRYDNLLSGVGITWKGTTKL